MAASTTLAATTTLLPLGPSPAPPSASAKMMVVVKRKRVEHHHHHCHDHDRTAATPESLPEPAGLPRPLKCVRQLLLPTGLVYDESHRLHKHPMRRHPERPERVDVIMTHLQAVGLSDACTLVPSTDAEDDDLAGVHNPHYLRRLRGLEGASMEKLQDEAEQFDSVYLNESSVGCARKAAGGLLEVVKGVVEGRLRNGMAMIRPPGHHAEAHHARGFCVINNVAVAASYARQKMGVKRVLIVDWDVHHGNGTQRAFLDDPSVLYFSLHRYDHGRFFPGGSDGSPSVVGTGPGAGYTVNVAWNGSGVGDAEYLEAWRKVLMPIAEAFDPDLVLVSAGFDGVTGDEMGGCELSPQCYGLLTRQLMGLGGGKVVLALEGGYRLSVLPQCVEECMRALLEGHQPPPPMMIMATPPPVAAPMDDDDDDDEHRSRSTSIIMPEAQVAIEETIRYHQGYLLSHHRAVACLAAAGQQAPAVVVGRRAALS